MNFEDLKLKEPIYSAVKKAGYQEPSPIQQKAIPALLARQDVLACAKTGTGKTAAFVLPILDLLADEKEHSIKALIMTPTRELAIQIFENFKKFGRYLKLRAVSVYGGTSISIQRKNLRLGCDILIATPGRLNDLIEQNEVSLSKVQVFVLDEADRMLDMGFIRDVKTIVAKLPENHQTVMLSATMPKEIELLANQLLKNPVDIRVDPPATPVDTIDQSLIFIQKGDKKRILADLLNSDEMKKAIVFTRTKVGADRLAKRLEEVGINLLVIHGDKTQGQRQNALQRFRTNQVNVLVATDVAARGIDVIDITHVFNYDMPEESEAYIHRIGRAGRAGKKGVAISFCCEEEMGLLAQIEAMLKNQIPEMKCQYSVFLERKQTSQNKKLNHRKSSRTSRNQVKGKSSNNQINPKERKGKSIQRKGKQSSRKNRKK